MTTTTQIWFPGTDRAVADATSQRFTAYVGTQFTPNILVLHSTETPSWPGYSGGAVAPNMTVRGDPNNQRVLFRQHFAADRSARALENRSGGVATNTLNAFQIEIIATCDPAKRNQWLAQGLKQDVHFFYTPELPSWFIDGLADIVRWLNHDFGLKIQNAAPRGWLSYPKSYGNSDGHRMTFAEWNNSYGICAHQDVPENAHGDAGAFPIDKLIAYATDGDVVVPDPIDPVVTSYDKMDPASYFPGVRGDHVTWLGQRLDAWRKAYGLASLYSVGPGPDLGPKDTEGVKWFQSRVLGATGVGADGWPGVISLRTLASTPALIPPIDPPPPVISTAPVIERYNQNLAAYDSVKGERTRESRARTIIPAYLDNFRPTWYHFQEISKDMLPIIDPIMAKRGYRRVPEGGKGRESYYRTDLHLEILEAKLLNVEHMLGGDTKEHLVIAWRIGDYRAVDVNFHNENEGTIQARQLRDVMTHGREAVDRLKIPRANLYIGGDSNLKTARAFVFAQGWRESRDIAKKKTDLNIKTTNAWSSRIVAGSAIDVDIFQRGADVLEAEVHFGSVISDHWGHRTKHRLVR